MSKSKKIKRMKKKAKREAKRKSKRAHVRRMKNQKKFARKLLIHEEVEVPLSGDEKESYTKTIITKVNKKDYERKHNIRIK